MFMWKTCHIFSLFVAIATRIFNIGRKEKDEQNLHTAIYPYIKFHIKIFSTFCVIAGSSFVDGRTDRRMFSQDSNYVDTLLFFLAIEKKIAT
jgi:hypothetical protein